MISILKSLWRLTLEPVYKALFKRFFEAILSRLNRILDEQLATREDVRRINARLDELDVHVRNVIASRWEDAAIARRLAMIEERLERNGQVDVPEPASGGADAP
jgi:hypothetical protein